MSPVGKSFPVDGNEPGDAAHMPACCLTMSQRVMSGRLRVLRGCRPSRSERLVRLMGKVPGDYGNNLFAANGKPRDLERPREKGK